MFKISEGTTTDCTVVSIDVTDVHFDVWGGTIERQIHLYLTRDEEKKFLGDFARTIEQFLQDEDLKEDNQKEIGND